MKRVRIVAITLLSLLLFCLLVTPALAQGFDQLPPLLASVLNKTAVIVDHMLDYWVTGNSLTDPDGQRLVAALAQAAVNTVHFLAQLVTLF